MGEPVHNGTPDEEEEEEEEAMMEDVDITFDEEMEGGGQEEDESAQGPHIVGGFTVLGDHKAHELKAVQRVLPNWLQYPKGITSKDVKQFSDLQELDKSLVERLEKNGLTQCFPAQWTVIPELLAQCRYSLYAGDAGFRPRDICVSAPTGSGKTLTFVLPIVQALKNRVVPHVRALVILPVKDLSQQVFDVFTKYTEGTQLKVCLLGGKMDFSTEQRHLLKERSGTNPTELWKSNVDIVVTTKGRLLDHIDRTPGFDLSHLRFLVVDEADRLMTDVNDNWLTRVETAAYTAKPHVFSPYSRPRQDGLTTAGCQQGTMHMQKLLFSATLSLNPDKLEQMSLYMPLLFTVAPPGSSNTLPFEYGGGEGAGEDAECDRSAISEQLEERYVDCEISEKPLILLHFMLNKKYEHVLCFTNSVETTNRLYLVLKQIPDLRVEQLTSYIHPNTRRRIIKDFESGKVQLLISSDIMTRGMDIQNVEYVISYDIPPYIETYIHRAGRTARANNTGIAISLVDGTEMPAFEKLLTETGRWDRLKDIRVKKKRMEPLLPAYTEALKEVPKILKSQKAKKWKSM